VYTLDPDAPAPTPPGPGNLAKLRALAPVTDETPAPKPARKAQDPYNFWPKPDPYYTNTWTPGRDFAIRSAVGG